MNVQQLNNNNFDNVIANGQKPILVDFYAEWCGPCKILSPIIEEFARDNIQIADVYKVNIDDLQDVASKFSIMSVPTLISFKNGVPYKKTTGIQSKEELLKLVK